MLGSGLRSMRRRRMGWLVSESVRVVMVDFCLTLADPNIVTRSALVLRSSCRNNHNYGRDHSFGVNHISHMLLVHTLLPLLDSTSQLPRNAGKKGAVRVVMQASQQHQLCPSDVKFESFEECQRDIGGNGK